MGASAIPVVLLFLLLAFGWRTMYTTNGDLVRAKEWGELARRSLPFLVLALMALSLFIVRGYEESYVILVWMVVFGILIVASSRLAIPTAERRANAAFRAGNYPVAAELYGSLAGEKPLARHHAFHGAALGASERLEESLSALDRSVEVDPDYGVAYYNRALVLRRLGRKTRAKKDLQKALEADLPRRFKTAARKVQEDLA